MRSRLATFIVLLSVIASSAWAQQKSIPVFAADEPNFGWTFDNGQEFPGATGSLAPDPSAKRDGKDTLKLEGNFSKGGNYVQAASPLPAQDLGRLSFWVRYPDNQGALTIRLVDGSDQCHQIGMKLQKTDEWQQVSFPVHEFFAKRGTPEALTNVTRYESWGGAADGKWHGPGKLLVLIIGPSADRSKPRILWLNDVAAAGVGQAAPAKMDFESVQKLPDGWNAEGNVTIDTSDAFKGKQSLLLSRAPEDVEKPCSVTGAPFPISPGTWQFSVAGKSALASPDASFSGVIAVEFLNAGGKVLETTKLIDTFGQKNWTPISRRIDPPALAATARFTAKLNKASGRFWLDELAASCVSAEVKKAPQVDRIMFRTAQTGNLLFPEDKRTVAVTVVALKKRTENQLDLTYALRDYWGAECSAAGKVALTEGKREGKTWKYEATIDLTDAPFETGRYYELYAEVAQEDDVPFRNYTSLSILPKPITKDYRPEEIPFTSRNWDGRIPVFFELADRLGVRISNIWSGWEWQPPYKGHAPTIELCQKLGMGVIAGVPTHAIERRDKDWQKYDDAALRGGLSAWIAKWGNVRPLFISLGNEPPVLEDRLAANVAAYKSLYEETKKIDPSITVISTSVGAAEPFFKAGFHKYCDVVDFHAYEDWKGIRETFAKYEEMFKKYGDKKPIWSTEIGLNSHGLARQTVAVTVVKKLTSFFSCGGESVSWFDLGYPDSSGKIADDSASAHNVFDCRYERYCPKLDAIAYYNMINGICIKKPAGEKLYGEDIYAFLFRDRDNHCMEVIWKEKGRQDVMLPLPGVAKVMSIDIDGRRSELNAAQKGVTLTINEDPLLLLFDSADLKLPEKLPTANVSLASIPDGIIKGGVANLKVALAGGIAADKLELTTPKIWQIAPAKADASSALFAISAPENTTAREGCIVLRIKDGSGGYSGELRTRLPVTGRVAARLMPEPAEGDKPAGVKVILQNYASEKQDVSWQVTLNGELPIDGGIFKKTISPTAYFADASEGTASLAPKATTEIVVPLAQVNPLNAYRIGARVTDSTGRVTTMERFMAGFVRVPHVKTAIKPDSSMQEPDWQAAPAVNLNEARQYFPYGKEVKWNGPQDLSGTLQFLWDEKCLYVGAKITDDVYTNNKVDGDMWAGDGLQFLVDPVRAEANKIGKYDIAVALTKKGPQAWCYLSADANSPAGEIKDFVISAKRLNTDRGDMTYVLAIPWTRLAPFKPAIGADLGLGMVINEDDGTGRKAFLGWFADVQAKQVDTSADLVLVP